MMNLHEHMFQVTAFISTAERYPIAVQSSDYPKFYVICSGSQSQSGGFQEAPESGYTIAIISVGLLQHAPTN